MENEDRILIRKTSEFFPGLSLNRGWKMNNKR